MDRFKPPGDDGPNMTKLREDWKQAFVNDALTAQMPDSMDEIESILTDADFEKRQMLALVRAGAKSADADVRLAANAWLHAAADVYAEREEDKWTESGGASER